MFVSMFLISNLSPGIHQYVQFRCYFQAGTTCLIRNSYQSRFRPLYQPYFVNKKKYFYYKQSEIENIYCKLTGFMRKNFRRFFSEEPTFIPKQCD